MKRAVLLVALLAGALAPARPSPAITIQFDYTYDTSGFFDGTAHLERRQTLELAGAALSGFTDDLAAIQASGSNWWDAGFWRPDTGQWDWAVHNLVVPADTLIVYVGGRNLLGSLGEGGPGGYSAGGSLAWYDLLEARGEAGALLPTPTDFGRWGGSIAFDSSPSYPWYFGASAGGLGAGQADFLSVATHELAHVLGFGTADSWDADHSGAVFTGAASVAENGGNVPLSTDTAHWGSGVKSTAGGALQDAAMTPSITIGTRKVFTDLDYAGLVDVGWERPVTPVQWNGASSNHWEKGINWSDGPAPGSGATARFDASAPRPPRLYADQAVERLEFRTAGWTLEGSAYALSVGDGGLVSEGPGTNTIQAAVRAAADQAWTVGAGNLLDLVGGLEVDGCTLTKDGGGTLTVTGPQDHAADALLVVAAGTVNLATDAGGHLSIEVDGGTVNFGASQHLDALAIGAGGRAVITPGGPKVLVLTSLWIDTGALGPLSLGDPGGTATSGAIGAVPEPATLGLLAAGALALLGRRRRREAVTK